MSVRTIELGGSNEKGKEGEKKKKNPDGRVRPWKGKKYTLNKKTKKAKCVRKSKFYIGGKIRLKGTCS